MADKIVSPKVRATLARVHESFPKFDKLPIEVRYFLFWIYYPGVLEELSACRKSPKLAFWDSPKRCS